MPDRSTPFSRFATVMLVNAERQLDQSQYAAAIVLAQAAVEMAAGEAFTTLIARKITTPVHPVLDLVPDRSFMHRRTQAFWTELTGTKITDPKEVWTGYRVHIERRNRVVQGQEWGDDKGARESVAAARAFMNRMAADLPPRISGGGGRRMLEPVPNRPGVELLSP